MSAYVLVHGGVHAAWCWKRWSAHLPTPVTMCKPLTCLDEPRPPVQPPTARSATSSTRSVRRWTAPPTAGARRTQHGGASTSQFAERRGGDVKEIVYLSAVVPQNGESAVSTLLEAGRDSALLADGAFVVAEDQTVTIPPEHVRAGFYGRREAADVQAAYRRICRLPIGPLTEALQLGPSFAAVKKTYIGATYDRAVPPALHRCSQSVPEQPSR